MDIETITTPPPADNGGGSSNETPKAEAKPDSSGTPEQKAEARKFKLKFGKTEREVDEAEALMLAQKGWASDEKFKSAKQLEREAKKILESADEDSLIQKKYGKSKFEWAKDYLKEQLRLKTMAPEEKAEFERKERIKQLEEKEAELLEREADRRLAEQTQRYQEQYDRELAAAIAKHKIPKNKYVVGRAVKIASELVSNDMEPDWDLVVGEAKRQVQDEISEMFTEDEGGLNWIGEDRVRKLMKLLVGRQTTGNPIAKVVKQIDGNKMEDKTPVDADDYWERKRQSWSK